SSRRRHTRFSRDWSSDVCSSDLFDRLPGIAVLHFDESRPVDEVIAELAATGLYESVEPDRAVRPLASPNDPAFSNGTLWGLHNKIGRAPCREREKILVVSRLVQE